MQYVLRKAPASIFVFKSGQAVSATQRDELLNVFGKAECGCLAGAQELASLSGCLLQRQTNLYPRARSATHVRSSRMERGIYENR